jgi:hypothetical protein
MLARKLGSSAKKKLLARAKRTLVYITINKPRITLKALSTPSKSSKKLNHYTIAKVLKQHGKAKH